MRMLPIMLLLLTVAAVQAEQLWDIPRVSQGPVLDGRLDDACWSDCAPRKGFTQRDPSPGAPSSEQTILRAVYTEDALYVAFECHDSQAERVVSRLRRRDASIWKDDNVDLWIDPTGSGMEMYYFSTNPSGVKYDALNGPRGQSSNQRWDAHWDVATAVCDWGWCAEFKVPFSNLKFDFDPSKPWLFNAGRVIRRSGEETYATSVPYEHNMFYSEDALRLQGIRDIAKEVGLKVSPYSKGDYRQFPGRLSTADDLQRGIGMDVDLDIGRSLTLATTVFPDFAEIDLDPDYYRIGFGQVYRGETRPFFLRDSNYFDTINFRPFYSRRVGKRLFDENGVYHDAEIVVGSRLTGAIGDVSTGAFYAHTAEALWEPESDWGAARARYGLGPRSFVGVVGSFRDARGVGYDRSDSPAYRFGSFGFDYEYYFTPTWNTWGTLVGTHDTRFEKNDLNAQYGHTAGMAWRRGTFEVWGNYMDVAERFSTNETGFTSMNDYRSVQGGVSYRVGFGNARFRHLGLNLSGGQYRQRDFTPGYEEYELSLSTLTSNSWQLRAGLTAGTDRIFFRPGHDARIAGGMVSFLSDPAKPFMIGGETKVGVSPDYTTGSRGTLLHQNVSVGCTPIPALQFGGNLEFNRWWMDAGEPSPDYDVTIWNANVDYLFTRELFLRVFGQGSTQDDRYAFRALLGWEYMPDSNIYLAYEQWRDNSAGDFELVNHGVFLKVDRFIQF